jgi:hypothetical protein
VPAKETYTAIFRVVYPETKADALCSVALTSAEDFYQFRNRSGLQQLWYSGYECSLVPSAMEVYNAKAGFSMLLTGGVVTAIMLVLDCIFSPKM